MGMQIGATVMAELTSPMISFVDRTGDLGRPSSNPLSVCGDASLREIRGPARTRGTYRGKTSRGHRSWSDAVGLALVPWNVAGGEQGLELVRWMIGKAMDSEPLANGRLTRSTVSGDVTC